MGAVVSRPLVHPRMLQSMPNVFQTTLRLQQPTYATNAYTREPEKTWANVSGLMEVKANVTPISDFTQSRLSEHYKEYTTHSISLQAYRPDIGDDWRAIDDDNDVTYTIRGIDTNSQNLYTILYCEQVNL